MDGNSCKTFVCLLTVIHLLLPTCMFLLYQPCLFHLSLLFVSFSNTSNTTPEIPIAKLGIWYAEQTGDRSLCVKQDDGSEYCTCVYQCGNGVWRNEGGGGSNSIVAKEDGAERGGSDGGSGDEVKDEIGERYGYWIQKGLGDKYGKWKYEVGCKKYCHAGVCDGQD